MTLTGYHRSFLPIAELDGPIPQETLDLLLGNQLEVTVGGALLADGTVTDAQIVNGRLMVVVESGGRGCAICRHIYPDDEAHLLVSASSFADKVRALRPASFADLTPWAPVCLNWPACEQRLLARESSTTEKASPTQ